MLLTENDAKIVNDWTVEHIKEYSEENRIDFIAEDGKITKAVAR